MATSGCSSGSGDVASDGLVIVESMRDSRGTIDHVGGVHISRDLAAAGAAAASSPVESAAPA
jgi:hypothetical protein